MCSSDLDTAKPLLSCLKPQNTSDFTLTTIEAIDYAGCEEVFDLQVGCTENFIANGLVSHNTRWHQDDLTGRVTRDMAQNDQADQYEVVEFPAILTVDRKITIKDEDTGKETVSTTTAEKPLWPELAES